MDKSTLEFVTQKTKELINVPHCYQGLKDKAAAWLEAVGTEKEKECTVEYIAQLESDIMPIDTAIAFAQSPKGIEILGRERAEAVAAASLKRKQEGEKYCGCDACAAAEAILNKKEEMLS